MSSPPPVTVAIVDDNAILRMGLRQLLETSDEVRVAFEASDGEQAVELTRVHQPDVVLLDVRMPRMDGVAAAEHVARHSRVLMLTSEEDASVVRSALRAGANGYLVHGQFRSDDLVAAVLATAAGSSMMSSAAIDAVRVALSAPPPQVPTAAPAAAADLTDRQREIMDCIAEGLANREIARRLFLSEKTVKNHVNHVFARLGVRSRAEAMAVWLGSATSGGPA